MRDVRLPSVYSLVTLDEVDSTNAEARRLCAQGEDAAPDGTVVWARRQTAGRGRWGRQWDSPEGNLFCSLIVRPDVPLSEASQLSFVAALGLYDALGSLGDPGHNVHLKWPNDVLLNEKKVAGILIETESSGKDVPEWMILGLGVNVGSHPDETNYPATSLRFETWGSTVEDVLEAFARSFLNWTSKWLDEGFDPVRRNWLWRCMGQGEEIQVTLEKETLSGVFKDLDADGALLLEVDGEVKRITTGDVFFPGAAA